MAMLFDVSVTSLEKVFDMPGTWNDNDYHRLLNQLEVEGVGDITGSDLLDIVLMALQDLEPREAADAVLACKLGTSTKPGVRQNLVQDLLEGQRPWEEASDIKLHSRIFASAVLLRQALPKIFAKPDMMRATLLLKGSSSEASAILSESPEAAFVARVLADGMGDNSILKRLFSTQLASRSFPEAEGIIWKADLSNQSLEKKSTADLSVFSSVHWLQAMEHISEFQTNAHNDSAEDDNEED